VNGVVTISELGRLSLFVRKALENNIICEAHLSINNGLTISFSAADEILERVRDIAREIWRDDDWDIGPSEPA
jgi:hypothetical protein